MTAKTSAQSAGPKDPLRPLHTVRPRGMLGAKRCDVRA